MIRQFQKLHVAAVAWMLIASLSNPLSSVCLGFAAKKNSARRKKATTKRTIKGFGAAPPTLEEILASFPTRIPKNENTAELPCPCGSGDVYGDCCGPLHDKTRLCLTMTDVLRSRYSAFSWRLIGHIIDTTDRTCRDWRDDKTAWAKDLNKQGMFDSFEFIGLDAGAEQPGDNENEGYIEFKVTLQGKENVVNNALAVAGKTTVVKEKSKFLRDPETGVWAYSAGDVTSEAQGLENTQLN